MELCTDIDMETSSACADYYLPRDNLRVVRDELTNLSTSTTTAVGRLLQKALCYAPFEFEKGEIQHEITFTIENQILLG